MDFVTIKKEANTKTIKQVIILHHIHTSEKERNRFSRMNDDQDQDKHAYER